LEVTNAIHSPNKAEKLFCWDVRYSFRLSHFKPKLYTLFCSNEETLFHIFHTCPDIDFFFTPGSFPVEKTTLDNVSAKILRSDQGNYEEITINARLIEPSEILAVLGKAANHTNLSTEKLIITEMLLDGDVGNPNTQDKLELSFHLIMSLDEPYITWSADRLSWVRRVEFDFSQMSSMISTPDLEMFFFNPNVHPRRELDRNHYIIDYEGWVLPGQGVSLNWKYI